MKSKKAQLIGMGIMGLMYLLLAIVLVFLVWWVFKGIDFGWLTSLFSFWQKWWWAISISIFAFTPVGQGVLKWILGKVGIGI